MPEKIIDLTHSLTPDIPSWDGGCCFSLETAIDYKDCTEPNLFRVQKMDGRAGAGTHIDAPAHCILGGKTIESLALDGLVTPCVVIDAGEDADENFLFMLEHIERFEKEHGAIEPNTFVLFRTGWSKHWDTPEKYRNDLHFPSIDVSVAEMLVARGVAGVGIDTLSPDSGGEDFPTHRVLLGAGKYIVENIANAEALTLTGAKISIMPMKIAGGTEAPVRIVAFI